MRFIVTKSKKDYELTHIEEKENLNGEMVEVIKGRNIIKKEILKKTIKQLEQDKKDNLNHITDEAIQRRIEALKEEVNVNDDLYTKQLIELNKMLEEINKIN